MTQNTFNAITIIINIIIGLGTLYLGWRLFPADLQNKQADTKSKDAVTYNQIMDMWRSTVNDLALANQKIERLENLQRAKLTAEIHIELTDPPKVTLARADYVIPDSS